MILKGVYPAFVKINLYLEDPLNSIFLGPQNIKYESRQI